MARAGPHTQSELAENLEQWYVNRASNVELRGGANAADWEKDKVFMALALSLWPVDMESAGEMDHHSTSARMRLRLRHEGFRGATDVSERLVTLLATADYVREQLKVGQK